MHLRWMNLSRATEGRDTPRDSCKMAEKGYGSHETISVHNPPSHGIRFDGFYVVTGEEMKRNKLEGCLCSVLNRYHYESTGN